MRRPEKEPPPPTERECQILDSLLSDGRIARVRDADGGGFHPHLTDLGRLALRVSAEPPSPT